jgi:hypothetical protein
MIKENLSHYTLHEKGSLQEGEGLMDEIRE